MNLKYKTYKFYLVKFRNENIYIGRTTRDDINKIKYYTQAALPRALYYLLDKHKDIPKKNIIKEINLIEVWKISTNDIHELQAINLILKKRYNPAVNRIRF